ncbi:outer membrane biosynthesis protein TonB [Bradymonas sediminis]|nr:outer membrane biosynthesis protein TonB [Bradymonas sediminis]
MQVIGFLTTFALHATIVGGIIYGAYATPEEDAVDAPVMMEFQNVELLALGEKKPPNQLPRVANPAPPEVKEKSVNLAKPAEEPPPKVEEKQPEAKPQKQESRRNKLLDDLQELNNPNRPTNDEVPEGSADGVASGTVSDAAMANMMNTYQVRLLEALGKYWRVPSTLTHEEINALAGKVAVYVRLSEGGHIVSFRFTTKSDNAQFDASIERLLRRFEVSGGRKLPMPEAPEVRDAVLRQGLNLRNWKAVTGK